MGWASVVELVVSAALFALAMAEFARFSRREPVVEGDRVSLRHGPAVAVLGGICLALGLGIVGPVLVGWMGGEPAWAVAMALVVGALFVWAGVACLVSYRLEFVRFGPGGVEGRSGIDREAVALAWGEVEAVTFSRLSGYLTVRGRGRQRVRVSALLHGADALAVVVERRLRADGVADGVRRFLAYRASYGLGPPKR